MGPALELGLGAKEVLSVPGTGRVVGVYSKAAYLRLPGGLAALTSFEVPSGPLHARTALPFTDLRPDDMVVVTGRLLQAGALLLAHHGAQVWEGRLPRRAELDSGRDVAVALLSGAPGSALEPEVVCRASLLVAAGDIPATAALLGGRGPGLTPAGDDCLAGILLVLGAGADEAFKERLCQIASSVDTNEIAGAFLRWAARGQSIAPVHRFLISATEGDEASASSALEELIGFGHSSGADLALGMKLALSATPPGTQDSGSRNTAVQPLTVRL